MGIFGKHTGFTVSPFAMGGDPVRRSFEIADQMMPKFAAQGAIDQAAAMPQQKRGGLFGMLGGINFDDLSGRLARAQAYIDGDWGAAQSITTQSDLQRQAEAQRQQSLDKREADYADFVRKEQWRRDNPQPGNPYRFEANDGDVYELGPDGQPRRLFDDPSPKMNFIPDGMGGGQWVPIPTGAPQGMGAAQPNRKVIGGKTYEQRNGQWFEVGGPTPSASGGFR
jgi:hypothetical protein